jgi:hypothetical protein
MRASLLAGVALALIAAGCSSASATPTPVVTASPMPVVTASPVVAASASTDPFAGQPYRVDLPPGWMAFDTSTPAAAASVYAMVQANPAFGGAFPQAFQAAPDVRIALNAVLGVVLVLVSTPSNGLSLAAIGQSFGASFQAAPGLVSKTVAESVTLPVGDALHWRISESVAKPGGGTVQVDESAYLVVNAQTAVIAVFSAVQGGGVPDELKVIQTLRFQP